MIRPLRGVLSGNPSGTDSDHFDRFLARLPNGSASLESGPTIEVRKRGAVRGLRRLVGLAARRVVTLIPVRWSIPNHWPGLWCQVVCAYVSLIFKVAAKGPSIRARSPRAYAVPAGIRC